MLHRPHLADLAAEAHVAAAGVPCALSDGALPASCTAVLPMSAKDYLAERDSAAFRSLLAEVCPLFPSTAT